VNVPSPRVRPHVAALWVTTLHLLLGVSPAFA